MPVFILPFEREEKNPGFFHLGNNFPNVIKQTPHIIAGFEL